MFLILFVVLCHDCAELEGYREESRKEERSCSFARIKEEEGVAV